MLSCKDVADRASGLIDGTLSHWEALRLRLHLAMCRGCSHFIVQMRVTDRLAASVAAHRTDPAIETAEASKAEESRLAELLSVLRTNRPERP